MQAFLEYIFHWFLNPNIRVYYLFLLSSLLLGAGYYYRYKHQAKRPFLKALLAYLFPRQIWLHRSAIIDYQIFVINTFFRLFLVIPFLMTSVQLTWWVVQSCNASFGPVEPLNWSASTITVLYTIVWLLISDFSRFLWHLCCTKFLSFGNCIVYITLRK